MDVLSFRDYCLSLPLTCIAAAARCCISIILSRFGFLLLSWFCCRLCKELSDLICILR